MSDILISNVIYIVLAVIVLVFGVGFIATQTSPTGPVENMYAKYFAFLVDGAKPDMEIAVDISSISNKISGYVSYVDAFQIQNGNVNVQLKKNSGSERLGKNYNYFNNIQVALGQECKSPDGKRVFLIVKTFSTETPKSDIDAYMNKGGKEICDEFLARQK